MIWTDQHASNLQVCLEKTPLEEKLKELRPPIEGKTLEDKAMSASETQGYERCIKELLALSQQQSQPQQKSAYIAGLEHFEERAQKST